MLVVVVGAGVVVVVVVVGVVGVVREAAEASLVWLMESQAEGKKRKEISTRKRRRASGSRSNSSEHSSGSSEVMATAAVSSQREAKMGKFGRVTRSRSSNGMNGGTGCLIVKKRIVTACHLHGSRGESSSAPATPVPAAAPILPAVGPSDEPLAGVVAARPREEPPQDNAIIPGLTDHLALYILALVPMSHHAPMKGVCNKWKKSLSSATGIGNEVLETRKASGIVEHWVFMLASGVRAQWRAIDPVQNKTRWLPECPCDYVFDSCDKESAVAGTQLLVSGHSGEGQIVWKYDLHKNEWSNGPRMLHARCLFASASFGKYAYFAGGSHDGSFLKSAERYNSESQEWEALPDLHYSRRWCSGCILDGKFFVIGGQGGRDSEKLPLTSGEYYDEEENKWVIVENMWPAALLQSPGQTAPPLVAVVDNELYCADATTMELNVYHKGTNTWRGLGKVPSRSVDSSGWGMGFKAVGKEIFVIGGNMATGVSCDQIHAWPMVRSNGEIDWRHVCQLPPQSGFIYNCAVMNV